MANFSRHYIMGGRLQSISTKIGIKQGRALSPLDSSLSAVRHGQQIKGHKEERS